MTGSSEHEDLRAAFGKDSEADLRSRSRVSLPEPISDAGAPTPVALPGSRKHEAAGRYRLQGEIARGGMGQILKGHDPDLGRDVAIKVLHDQYREHDEVLDRFVEEAQIGGQLQHPGIVPVYELGVHDQRPFFAMKLVKGQTLAALLAARKQPGDDRRKLLDVFEAVCQTMAYAHARSVLHRDLKPANVLVGAFGEVQVVDWGLAKVMARGGVADEKKSKEHSRASVIETVRSKPGSDGSQSRVGSVLGTPAYMPPEQARGDMDSLDERADVFALGAILCEILTGAPPYVGGDGRDDGDQTLLLAARGQLEPALGRLQTCGADAELVSICEQCLAPAKQARHANAGVLAEKVSAYLHAVEERAQQAELRAAQARFRQRTTLIVSLAALLLVSLGAGGWIWTEQQAEQRRRNATQRASLAIGEARSRHGEALARSDDASLWERAVTSAEAAQQLARAADVDPGVRSDGEALLQTVQQARQVAQQRADRLAKDAEMRERLVSLRIPRGSALLNDDFRKQQGARLDRAYEQALAWYLGASPLLPAANAALTAARGGGIATELAAAFDHWSLVAQDLATLGELDQARADRVAAIAGSFDTDDPWRRQLRPLLVDPKANTDELLAIARAESSMDRAPTDVVLLADALWFAEEWQQTLATLESGSERHPADADVCLRLAFYQRSAFFRYEADMQLLRDELVTLRRARALLPDSRKLWLRYVDSFKYAAMSRLVPMVDAERIARHALARFPDDPRAVQIVANIIGWRAGLRGQGGNREILALLQEHDAAVQKNPMLLATRGTSLLELGDLKAARVDIERALELGPDFEHARLALAQLQCENGEPEQAIPDVERMRDKSPFQTAFLSRLWSAYYGAARYEDALLCCEALVQQTPQIPEGHIRVAKTLQHLGQYERAEASLQRAEQLLPNSWRIAVARATMLSIAGQHEQAIQGYEELLLRSPQSSLLRHLLAQAMVESGAARESLEHWQATLESDDIRVRSWYGRALREAGELGRAIEMLESALVQAPASRRAHLELGLALAERAGPGDRQSAREHFERALQIAPTHPRVLEQAARFYREVLDEQERAALAGRELVEDYLQRAGAPAAGGSSRTEASMRARWARLAAEDYRGRVALVFELLDAERPATERFPALALEVAREANKLTRSVKAGPLQALAEALFANGDGEAATSKMYRAMRARSEQGDRDAAWMQARIEEYGK